MAFINIFFSFFLHANELPPLLTKQEISNIRFISDDGRLTYYQRRSGTLLLSTNYDVHELIQLSEGTQYRVASSFDSENLVIEAKEHFHSNLDLRSHHKIFTTQRGATQVREIGEGVDAALHVQGQWVSYFRPAEKKVRIQNLRSDALFFDIVLNNKINPYFRPQVLMPRSDLIFYTDLNEEGFQGIMSYNRSSEEISLLLKTSSPTQHINICLLNNHLVIQEIGAINNNTSTMIHTLPLSDLNIDRKETIYQSAHNDLGNLLCDRINEEIFFIQSTRDTTHRQTSEVSKVSITKDDNQEYPLEVISSLQFVTQVVKMDKSILIPYRENIFVYRGQSDYTSTDLLQRNILEDQGSTP